MSFLCFFSPLSFLPSTGDEIQGLTHAKHTRSLTYTVLITVRVGYKQRSPTLCGKHNAGGHVCRESKVVKIYTREGLRASLIICTCQHNAVAGAPESTRQASVIIGIEDFSSEILEMGAPTACVAGEGARGVVTMT